eukprot:g2266.t1
MATNPKKKTQVFSTAEDNQPGVNIVVTQGERKLPETSFSFTLASSAPYICFICGKTIKKKNTFLYHIAIHPTEIVPNIWLGNEDNANNLSLLRRLGITHVLNVAGDIDAPALSSSPSIVYKHLKVMDNLSENISVHFSDTNHWISEAISSSNSSAVLVHCHLGVSRAPSFVCAYLMNKYNVSMDDALGHIKNIRVTVNPNENFLEQLGKYGNK